MSAHFTSTQRKKSLLMRILAGTLCIIAFAVWYFQSALRARAVARQEAAWRADAWRELKNLERQAKENLNPAELQQWATNLLVRHWAQHQRWEQYYGTNFYSSTNFPSGLRKIGCFSDGITILIDTQQRDVAIFTMTKGGPSINAGAPTLAAPTNRTFIQWTPGIYFCGAVVP